MEEKNKNNQIIIYSTKKGGADVEVQVKNESIWLDAHKIAVIFGVNRPAIVKHIQNIYKTKELDEKSTCSKMEQVAADGKIRKMNLYNLDMIISVGYRVNSRRATQFRIWATKTLKQYLIQGYAINKKRLLEVKGKFNQLQQTIDFLQKQSKKELLHGQEAEILSLLKDYSKTLSLLEQYDKGELKGKAGKKSKFVLDYKTCKNIIVEVKKELMAKKEAGDLFGCEKQEEMEGIVKGLYQTFVKKELYKSIEDKSAHLLYFVIKDHPFVDGNKRIASFLFVYFLDKNNYLYRENGEKKINDNALTALSLLVVESNPKEKDHIIDLIKQLLA
ncbi:MAG: virulence protein RhuM/Fic/DOC family protein [Candidatus Magasanikbacteria bacterium]